MCAYVGVGKPKSPFLNPPPMEPPWIRWNRWNLRLESPIISQLQYHLKELFLRALRAGVQNLSLQLKSSAAASRPNSSKGDQAIQAEAPSSLRGAEAAGLSLRRGAGVQHQHLGMKLRLQSQSFIRPRWPYLTAQFVLQPVPHCENHAAVFFHAASLALPPPHHKDGTAMSFFCEHDPAPSSRAASTVLRLSVSTPHLSVSGGD